jgi:hypothetical protein
VVRGIVFLAIQINESIHFGLGFLKGKIMNAKNPKYNEDGTIDIDIESEKYGWIPFTASPTDVEAHGRGIFADIVAGKYGPISEYVAPPQPVEPAVDGAQTL